MTALRDVLDKLITKELSKPHPQEINHTRKMKDARAGASRADRLQGYPSLGVRTLKGHSVSSSLGRGKRPNSSFTSIDFLHALGDRVTHTHTHPQSFALSPSVSPSHTHKAAEDTWRRGHSFTCYANK